MTQGLPRCHPFLRVIRQQAVEQLNAIRSKFGEHLHTALDVRISEWPLQIGQGRTLQ